MIAFTFDSSSPLVCHSGSLKKGMLLKFALGSMCKKKKSAMNKEKISLGFTLNRSFDGSDQVVRPSSRSACLFHRFSRKNGNGIRRRTMFCSSSSEETIVLHNPPFCQTCVVPLRGLSNIFLSNFV